MTDIDTRLFQLLVRYGSDERMDLDEEDEAFSQLGADFASARAYNDAVGHLADYPLYSVREYRTLVPSLDPQFASADNLLFRLVSNMAKKPQTHEHLAAVDELLDGAYPGIDVASAVPRALVKATQFGNLPMIGHLIPRLPSETADMLLDQISGSAQEAPWHAPSSTSC